MERKKSAAGGVSVGSSSILVIFVVLALTAFAALSLTTAGSDLRLTQKVARATQEYYAADGEAVELAAQLQKAQDTARPETFPGEAAALGWTVNGLFANRSVVLGEGQTLEITADFSQTPIRFTRWQVVNTADWQEQDSFTLWDGGEWNLAAVPGEDAAIPVTPPPLPGFKPQEKAAAAVIGGADGPTDISITTEPADGITAAGKE